MKDKKNIFFMFVKLMISLLVSTSRSTVRVKPLYTSLPLCLRE
jgi:hypothetical protein